MEENSGGEWKGKAMAEVKGLSAEQVWCFMADFCNLHNLFPNIETCYRVEGELAKPGLVRYCASTSKSKWVKEKLVMISPEERCLSYEILDNNMGFKSYVATFKVLPLNSDGSKIEWSFVVDPVQGMLLEDFESYLHSCLHFMAKKIEASLSF